MSFATVNTRCDSDVHALMMLLFFYHNKLFCLKEDESRFPFLMPWALLGTGPPAEVMRAFRVFPILFVLRHSFSLLTVVISNKCWKDVG